VPGALPKTEGMEMRVLGARLWISHRIDNGCIIEYRSITSNRLGFFDVFLSFVHPIEVCFRVFLNSFVLKVLRLALEVPSASFSYPLKNEGMAVERVKRDSRDTMDLQAALKFLFLIILLLTFLLST
jgi:hypothetical protein